jgi:hypothetical protein
MYKESVDRSAFKEVGNGSLDWKAVLRAGHLAAGRDIDPWFGENTRRTVLARIARCHKGYDGLLSCAMDSTGHVFWVL